MNSRTIGMRIEDKSLEERRAPLTPENISTLVNDEGFKVKVQPSKSRVFPDSAYEAAGAEVNDDLSNCDIIIGIKEVPVHRLIPKKPHVFFSHTIKGQEYNMGLLQEILDKEITLIDYEKVTDEKGMRIIAFSYQAGQAGMLNTIWSLGQRYKEQGINTPLAKLKQASKYENGLDEAKIDFKVVAEEIKSNGLPKEITPLVIAITGGPGRVSAGAQDVLDVMDPVEISPEELLNGDLVKNFHSNRIYKVVLDVPDFIKPINDSDSFEFMDYVNHPEKYRSTFNTYIPFISALVNGIYWEEKYPRLLTKETVRKLYLDGNKPKLTVVGDVTCDPLGSIECNLKPTYPDNPVYVYKPETDSLEYGFSGDGLQMMPVDILPTEIPQVSSKSFGEMLMPFVSALASADYSQSFSDLDIPAEFKRAVIAHHGKLTPDFQYIQEFLKR